MMDSMDRLDAEIDRRDEEEMMYWQWRTEEEQAVDDLRRRCQWYDWLYHFFTTEIWT